MIQSSEDGEGCSEKANFLDEVLCVRICALTGLRGRGERGRGKVPERAGAWSPYGMEMRSVRLELKVKRGCRKSIFCAKKIDIEKSVPCPENSGVIAFGPGFQHLRRKSGSF